MFAALRRGQSFNELSALQGPACPASAEAATDCMVIHIDLQAVCFFRDATREVERAANR